MNNRQNPFSRFRQTAVVANKKLAAIGALRRFFRTPLTTEQNLLVVSLVLVLGIILLGYKGYQNNQSNRETTQLIDHTRQVLLDAEKISTAVKDLELGVRGYVITGDYTYLGPFYTTRQSVFTRIKNLKILCADNAAQQTRLDLLKNNLEQKLDFLEQCIALRKKKGAAAAENFIAANAAVNKIDFLDKTIEEIKANESKTLAIRKVASARTNDIFSKISFFLASLMVLLVIAATYTLWKNTQITTTARRQLEDNRQLLQGIIDNTSSIIYVKDIYGRYTMINRQFEKTYNTSAEAVLGKTVFDINDEDFAMEFARNDARVLEERSLIEIEEQAQFNNETRYYYAIKFPLINRNDEVYGIAGISTDITDIILKQQIQKERDLVEQTLKTQENERKEIGIELHDNISQLLASAKMMLDTALRNVERRDERLEKAREDVFTAINETRKLSHSLVSPISENQSLTVAIEDLVKGLNLGTKIRTGVSFTGKKQINSLDEKLKLTIYRIIQEQTHNIVKYSRAKSAAISLMVHNEQFVMKISDDGVGFDVEKKGRGIGLQNICNRTEFYSGKMDIVSAPGKGCQLTIEIPLLPVEVNAV